MTKKTRQKKKTEHKVRDDLPSDSELDALQSQIDALKAQPTETEAVNETSIPEIITDAQRISQLETELAHVQDQNLRTVAEIENIKKRTEREVQAARLYGIERLATDILSVYDNLNRALLTLDGKTRENLGDNAQSLLAGIELTEKDLMAVMARHGITVVAGKGTKFDPNIHQAVAQVPSDEEKGRIVDVMQTGFRLGERTLRAAMVSISAGQTKP